MTPTPHPRRNHQPTGAAALAEDASASKNSWRGAAQQVARFAGEVRF